MRPSKLRTFHKPAVIETLQCHKKWCIKRLVKYLPQFFNCCVDVSNEKSSPHKEWIRFQKFFLRAFGGKGNDLGTAMHIKKIKLMLSNILVSFDSYPTSVNGHKGIISSLKTSLAVAFFLEPGLQIKKMCQIFGQP